jgi:polyhydroxybutyrate depolymerase
VEKVYGPGEDGAEVVLVEIEGGGHTWPGKRPPVDFIGRSTMDISANDMIWDFFERHPMK